MILSAAELATIWGPPTADVIDLVETVGARWLPAPAKAFVDPANPRTITMGYGQKSDGSWAPIGIPYDQLRYVMWVTAPMGRGKSEWLKWVFNELFRAGSGLMGLDLKGTDLVNGTIPLIPLAREKDVVILDLNGMRVNGEHLYAAMNLLSGDFGRSLGIDYDTQASTVLSFFSSLDERFDSAPGMQNFATMGMLALLEGERSATMQHLVRLYADEDYRNEVCADLTNKPVQDFWLSRFPEMSSQDTGSLVSFQRRIDLLLTYPALAALMVAPGCSINVRELMDTGGILLAGISAKDGKIASIAATLLLTQMTLAALSRVNVPEAQRPDWPVVIDEAQIVFEKNPGMAPVMFSQLRAMRIGTMVVHQNIEQLNAILGVLSGNAQNRLILGAELEDATAYGNNYRALGMVKEDFLNMERFEHQYMKLYGTDAQLFSAQMPGMVSPLEEPAPPPVSTNWRTRQAAVRSPSDARLDAAIGRFKEMAVVDEAKAVTQLGMLMMQDPQAYTAYCERTRQHRLVQREFILNHPGCIPHKERRIRTLSALRVGVPRIETKALQWALLMQSREAAQARAARAEEEKAAKKGGGKKPKAAPSAPGRAAPSAAPAIPTEALLDPFSTSAGAATTALPSLETLLAETAGTLAARETRRDAADIAEGFEV
ncbi:ATP-binding protein [Chloroflexia bacterium SDU3-3]|nr:ATP-binding protein [Chloroflexia bacterium SDU3-3]